MSYGNTPPPGGPSDSGNDPTEPTQDSPAPGYGAPPPPPSYSAPPPPYSAPSPSSSAPPPPPNPYGAPPPAYGSSPQYGAAPPPPFFGQQDASGVGTLALWPARALGFIIDYALYIPGFILTSIGSQNGSRGVLYLIGSLYILGIAIWNRWMKGGSTGQTIGRGVIGTKLVSEKTGQPIGAGMAFVRDLAHIVDGIICYVGYLFPLWDSKRQTLADKIMSTVVITSPKTT